MRRLGWILVTVAAGGGILGAAVLRTQSPTAAIETIGFSRPLETAPAMCPWRTPQVDMKEFFPGATRSETRTLVLSGLRVALKKRLGPNSPQEANILYAYTVYQNKMRRGTVLVQRAAGEYGALELVLGVGPDGRVAGARVQRCREPQSIASAIESPRWLNAFRGKNAHSLWTVGADLPAVSPLARPAAVVVAKTARALLIELDEAAKEAPSAPNSGGTVRTQTPPELGDGGLL